MWLLEQVHLNMNDIMVLINLYTATKNFILLENEQLIQFNT